MNIEYEKFRQEQEKKNYFASREAEKAGNMAYNRGLVEGLWFFKLWLYPLLMRRDT